jgi:hypothetical protein
VTRLVQAFVITASSVVIAVGGVWLYRQYSAHQALESCIKGLVLYNDEQSKKENLDFVYWYWKEKTAQEKRDHVKHECVRDLRLDGTLPE